MPLPASQAAARSSAPTGNDEVTRWHELDATASAVRARPSCGHPAGRNRRRPATGALMGILCAGAVFASGSQRPAFASNPAADTGLLDLTNQDRASNGIHALQRQSKLGQIADNLPYSGCGFAVQGRSQDMINRNYFNHPILGCGQLVFPMMTANGVNYLSAGENIGWSSGTSNLQTDPCKGFASGSACSAAYINGQFMNSPEHRDNILNRSYTHAGIGTAQSNGWTGGSCPGRTSCTDVWMFSEEFVQLTPPQAPPTPAPPHQTSLPPRNDPAPPPPQVPPSTTEPVAPAPTPEPSAVPSPPADVRPPSSGGIGTGAPSPLISATPGLLSDSVEAVLEAYLVD